jgi:hypothetical protein
VVGVFGCAESSDEAEFSDEAESSDEADGLVAASSLEHPATGADSTVSDTQRAAIHRALGRPNGIV